MAEEYTQERAAKYADKILELQDEIADREEAVANLKAKLASWIGEDEVVVDGRNIRVYHHKAFNADYAKKNFPELVEKGSAQKTVFTSATAKAALTAEEYAKVQKISPDFSVVVSLVEE